MKEELNSGEIKQQQQVAAASSSNNENDSSAHEEETPMNVDTDEDKTEEKQMIGGCCVCSFDSGLPDNSLVYCDGKGCQVAVHQACYGIVTIPEGDWFCSPCEYKRQLPKKCDKQLHQISCQFCPISEGALKRTDAGEWAHVVCALYVPEITFGNIRTMEPIITKDLNPERYNKKCSICETTNEKKDLKRSVYVNCEKTNCKHWFHVTCAQVEGLLCEDNSLNRVKYSIYCKNHITKINPSLVKRIDRYVFYSTSSGTVTEVPSTSKKGQKLKRESNGVSAKKKTKSENDRKSINNLKESVVKDEELEENLNYVYDVQDSKELETSSENSIVKSKKETRAKKNSTSSLSSSGSSSLSNSNKRKAKNMTDAVEESSSKTTSKATPSNKRQHVDQSKQNANANSGSVSLLSPASNSDHVKTKRVEPKSNETTSSTTMLTPPPSVPYQHQSSNTVVSNQETHQATASIDIFGNYLANGGSKSDENKPSVELKKNESVLESMTTESYLAHGGTKFPETMDELLRWQFASTETLLNDTLKKLDIMDFLHLIQESKKEKEELAKRLKRLQAENEHLTQLSKKSMPTASNPALSSNQISISRSNSDTQVVTGSSSFSIPNNLSTVRSPSVTIPIMSQHQLQTPPAASIINHKPHIIHSPISSSSPSPVKAPRHHPQLPAPSQLANLTAQASTLSALLNHAMKHSPSNPSHTGQLQDLMQNADSLSILSNAAQIVSEPGFNNNNGSQNNMTMPIQQPPAIINHQISAYQTLFNNNPLLRQYLSSFSSPVQANILIPNGSVISDPVTGLISLSNSSSVNPVNLYPAGSNGNRPAY